MQSVSSQRLLFVRHSSITLMDWWCAYVADISPRDYRAWYGLGQTYEFLKMTDFALYYYKQAQKLKYVELLLLVVIRMIASSVVAHRRGKWDT